jgi:hypothetical protein
VVRNKVEDDLELFCMSFINEAIKTFERAEDRIDPTVVGDIVTEVMHRRRINRRNPDRIDAEPDEIIEPLSNAVEIAYSVTVRILKRPRVDLIECADLPPMIHAATVWYAQTLIIVTYDQRFLSLFADLVDDLRTLYDFSVVHQFENTRPSAGLGFAGSAVHNRYASRARLRKRTY